MRARICLNMIVKNEAAVFTAFGTSHHASAGTGDNSPTWTPTITIAVPGGMAANIYSATITHSVL